MAAKQIVYSRAARAAIPPGASTRFANAVKVTLRSQGPQRRHREVVGLARHHQGRRDRRPKRFELGSKLENNGRAEVREVASKTSDKAGDGTTTATVLAQADLTAKGLRLVEAGIQPDGHQARHRRRRRGDARGRQDGPRSPPRTKAQIAQGRDRERQRRRRDRRDPRQTRWRRSAREGVITVEENKKMETELEDRRRQCSSSGYLSPYFVTDTEKMTAVLNNPLILIHEKKIGANGRSFAAPRAGPQGRTRALDPLGGRRGRGARHARRQQAPRHDQGRRVRRPVRRSPQGDAEDIAILTGATATLIVPRSLLTTSVASASPSTSSERIKSSRPPLEDLLEERQKNRPWRRFSSRG